MPLGPASGNAPETLFRGWWVDPNSKFGNGVNKVETPETAHGCLVVSTIGIAPNGSEEMSPNANPTNPIRRELVGKGGSCVCSRAAQKKNEAKNLKKNNQLRKKAKGDLLFSLTFTYHGCPLLCVPFFAFL